jgi:hypothetical protein
MSADAPLGIMLCDVVPQTVSWLWDGRIPLGKLTVLDGDPGLGKSTLTLAVAAHVSRGIPLPGSSEPSEAAGVVLLSAEDDLADTVRPRLDAAGADVSRVLALKSVPDGDDERLASLPADAFLLRQAIARTGARLVVVDPLMAWLDSSVDSHKDQGVRHALHKLASLAEDSGAAFLIVRHLNKAVGGNPLYRGGGSIGIIGAARSGLLVGRDPDDPTSRVLASTKCNLAAEPDSLRFHLEQHEGASRVVFDGTSLHGAAAVLDTDTNPTALNEAKDVVRDILSDGPMSATEARRVAVDRGIADRTLDRATKALGVLKRKRGMTGGWTWSLPEHVGNVGELGDLGDVGRLPEAETPIGDEDEIEVID